MARRRPTGDDDAIRLSNPLGFLQIAAQRLEDAEFLQGGQRNTAALYLAGYAIECALKSLIRSALTTPQRRLAQVRGFRGVWAHDFGLLLETYYAITKSLNLPPEMIKSFSRVNTWSTDLRYRATLTSGGEVQSFLDDTRAIIQWVRGRVGA